MPRPSQMRRKMMRSMMRCTAKLSSRWLSFGLRKARLRASSARQPSMVLRNSSSTSAVPRLALLASANLSNAPLRTASRENTPAIIDREFLEVAQDVQKQLQREGVSAKLEGGGGIVFDVHGWPLGFQKKLSRATDAEAVIRGLGRFPDLDGVLVDNVFIGFGVAGGVFHVPAERLEKRIQEFAPDLGFVVVAGAVRVPVALEALNEFEDFLWCGHNDQTVADGFSGLRRILQLSPEPESVLQRDKGAASGECESAPL